MPFYNRMGNTLGAISNSTLTNNLNGQNRKRTRTDSTDEGPHQAKQIKRTILLSERPKITISQQDERLTIQMLGKQWSLNKNDLETRSEYFKSMFSGSWAESGKSLVEVYVVDSNITLEGLDVVFKSVDMGEMEVNIEHIVPILAAAHMFQMDELVNANVQIMVDNISPETVINYNDVGEFYGLPGLYEPARRFLAKNLMTTYANDQSSLILISPQLMKSILQHPELFVVENEIDLYNLLKLWMYLRCVENQTNPEPMESYFSTHKESPFIMSGVGAKYHTVFHQLNIKHIISMDNNITTLLKDNIFMPKLVLLVYEMSRADQRSRTHHSFQRFGHIIPHQGFHHWTYANQIFGNSQIVFEFHIDSTLHVRKSQPEGLTTNPNYVDRVAIKIELFNLLPNKQINKSCKINLSTLLIRNNNQLLLDAREKGILAASDFPLYVSIRLKVLC